MNIQMTSILARTKQIPTDGQYFISLVPLQRLSYLVPDTNASTTSYVSGALAGRFQQSNVTTTLPDSSGGLLIFRDMGSTLVSSGRTFRGIQLLVLDGNLATGGGGQSGWTSSNAGTAGVWQPSTGGVNGGPGVAGTSSPFRTFYFETGAQGLGIAQGLVRYG
jgi:hypothetical protein